MKYNTFLLIGTALLLGAFPMMSQPAPESPVSITFSAFSWAEPATDLYYRTDNEHRPLMVPNASLTTEKDYTGPPRLEFFRQIEHPEGRRFETVGSVLIPPDAPRVLLIFLPDDTDASRYRVLSFPAARDEFAAGSARFLNLSTRQLAIQVEGRKFLLEPRRGAETVSPDTENPHWTLQMAVDNDAGWELIYRTRWRIYPNQRLLVFLTDSSQGQSPVDLKLIRENVAKPESATPLPES